MQHVITLLFLGIFSLSTLCFSAGVAKTEKAELAKETILKKYPTEDAATVGRLPKGTILELSGEEDNFFAEAEVELANGTVASGWVEIASIRGREKERPKEKPKPVKKSNKLIVPKDEGVLLRRERTFFYGIGGGGNYSIVNYIEGLETYNGMSFNVDAHVGLYFGSYIRSQFNVGYLQTNGVDSTSSIVSFGFFNFSLEGQLVVEENFLIFADLGYMSGMSVAAPNAVKITGASDASTLFSQIGAGYRTTLNELSSIGVKGSYLFGFQRDPIGVQGFVLSIFVDFEG